MFRAGFPHRLAARCALIVVAVRIAAAAVARAADGALASAYHDKHERLLKIRARYRAAQENVEALTLGEYYDLLDGHDWSYSFSDDLRAFANGEKQARLLDAVVEKRGDAFAALQEAFRAHHYGGDGRQTPAAPKPSRPAAATAKVEAPREGDCLTRAAS